MIILPAEKTPSAFSFQIIGWNVKIAPPENLHPFGAYPEIGWVLKSSEKASFPNTIHPPSDFFKTVGGIDKLMSD